MVFIIAFIGLIVSGGTAISSIALSIDPTAVANPRIRASQPTSSGSVPCHAHFIAYPDTHSTKWKIKCVLTHQRGHQNGNMTPGVGRQIV